MALPVSWTDHITKLQQYLSAEGFDVSGAATGVFDDKTKQAWQMLCRRNGRDQYREFFQIPDAAFPDWMNELLEDFAGGADSLSLSGDDFALTITFRDNDNSSSLTRWAGQEDRIYFDFSDAAWPEHEDLFIVRNVVQLYDSEDNMVWEDDDTFWDVEYDPETPHRSNDNVYLGEDDGAVPPGEYTVKVFLRTLDDSENILATSPEITFSVTLTEPDALVLPEDIEVNFEETSYPASFDVYGYITSANFPAGKRFEYEVEVTSDGDPETPLIYTGFYSNASEYDSIGWGSYEGAMEEGILSLRARIRYPYGDWSAWITSDDTALYQIPISFTIGVVTNGAWTGYSVPNSWGTLGENNLSSFGLTLREMISNDGGFGGIVFTGDKVSELNGKSLYVGGSGPFSGTWTFDNTNTSLWWASDIPFMFAGGNNYEVIIR